MNDSTKLAESLAMLELQNYALIALVAVVGGGLFFMIRVAWAELKQANKENAQKLGEHDVALGVLMERHETSKAIKESGDTISAAIRANSDRLIEKLQAITPSSGSRR